MRFHENNQTTLKAILRDHAATQSGLSRKVPLQGVVVSRTIDRAFTISDNELAINAAAEFVADLLRRHMRSGMTMSDALAIEKEIDDRPVAVWDRAVKLAA